MKLLISAIALIISSTAQAVPSSKDITVNLSEVFVAGSFKISDEASIVVSGIFPNSCYSWQYGLVTHPKPNSHEVKGIASVSQGMCLMVLVPFQKEIKLGRLPQGQHTLKINNGDGTSFERTFVVD